MATSSITSVHIRRSFITSEGRVHLSIGSHPHLHPPTKPTLPFHLTHGTRNLSCPHLPLVSPFAKASSTKPRVICPRTAWISRSHLPLNSRGRFSRCLS